MPNTYQQAFQQPAWNTDSGAQLVDATVNVTLVGITDPLPAGANLLGNVGQVLPAGATRWNVRATSVAAAAVTATQAAVAGKQHYLLGYQACLRAAPAANDAGISVKDGATEKLYDVIGSAAPAGTRCQLASAMPILVGTVNTALNLVAAAAGAGAIVEISMWGYTV